ncbi:diguanylate cyclase [Dapis sp. BLCC M126]|uniref:diguanylate cyclase n=1 Tax=Dapis sp. BLCC M126 TaxID=3400189 RepID=UPI003CF6FFF1
MQRPKLANILVVDDLPANLKVLVNILKNQDYKIRKVTNGQSAIKAVKKELPDLILLDIKMPDMDGYEVCQKLKSDKETKDIPIIFISALSEVFDKVKAFEVGGIDYITKPFQQEEVLARIKSQLTIQNQKILLQKEKALISSILTNSLDGIAALEAVRNPKTSKIESFRCLVINPILAKVFYQNVENLTGKLISQKLINQIDTNLFDLFVRIVETGIPLNRDLTYEYEKVQKWYNFSAVKLADGLTITVRDITARKKVELELNSLATRDGLTGIYNRRSFDEILVREWGRCQREKQFLSLILCDVDYFKLYNDFYGHQGGDNCLKQIAKTINDALKRSSDLVARYGGEEFVVILPHTNREGAIALVENIQKAIRLQAIPHEKSEVSAVVSLSLGIASMIPTLESSPNTLIEMADQALYQAKDRGRDCYSVNS